MSQPPFTVASSTDQGITRLCVGGEIDMTVSDTLTSAIVAAVGSSEAVEVLIELAEVTFMDSRGTEALLVGYRTAAEAGRPYRIVNPSRQVRRILEVSGVLSLLMAGPDLGR